jgi:hypothetical protein
VTIAFLRIDATGAIVGRCVAADRAEALERLAPSPDECVVSAASYAVAPVRPVVAPRTVEPVTVCTRCRCPNHPVREGRRQCRQCEHDGKRRRRGACSRCKSRQPEAESRLCTRCLWANRKTAKDRRDIARAKRRSV